VGVDEKKVDNAYYHILCNTQSLWVLEADEGPVRRLESTRQRTRSLTHCQCAVGLPTKVIFPGIVVEDLLQHTHKQAMVGRRAIEAYHSIWRTYTNVKATDYEQDSLRRSQDILRSHIWSRLILMCPGRRLLPTESVRTCPSLHRFRT
jgi:hypothetical protein